jgi:hypothetical protein
MKRKGEIWTSNKQEAQMSPESSIGIQRFITQLTIVAYANYFIVQDFNTINYVFSFPVLINKHRPSDQNMCKFAYCNNDSCHK